MNQMSADNGEAGICIIDQDYRIIYMNDRAKAYYPNLKTGMYCLDELGSDSAFCKVWPELHKDSGHMIFYDAASRLWLNLSSGLIDWPGYEGSRLIMFRPVVEQNRNLFYNLTDNTVYDELFELHIWSNTYKILFCEKDKFKIPASEGVLDQMYAEVAETMLHPDDRKAFREFWECTSLLDRLNSNGRIMKGEFRKQLLDESYRWVRLSAVLFRDESCEGPIIMCYVQDIDNLKKKEEEQKLQQEKRDETDSLTGLLRYGPFFEKARRFLERKPEAPYFMVAIDIEHFKLYNEWYGEKEGDRFLIKISGYLKEMEGTFESIAGYMGGDDFVIILPQDLSLLNQLEHQINCYARQYGGYGGFLPAFGVYSIKNRYLSVSTMYDRAIIALNSIKGNYAKRIGWYDPGMKQKMEDDQVLLSEIQRALENQEFIFYVQPQCNMLTGKIIGMESLVRWQHPVRGIISPGEFIPHLERNGFIIHLDLYIWEMVCRQFSSWIKAGCHPIPISVNMSRMDIYGINVVEKFKQLVKQYEIDPKYLEIEITESAYAEDYELIRKVVEDLRKAGFPVFMDDFGSGYSSLNMLRDVNVDVIKIDTKFLDMNENSKRRGMGILETIVRMARVMQFKVIAEGIEEKEQADFLINIGCIYGQGYYYYKPMSVTEMEELLKNDSNLDYRGIQARQMRELKLEDLFNENITSEAMMNNVLGAIALYEVYEDNCGLLRVNEEYYRITGDNPVDLGESREFLQQKVYQDDRDRVLRIFENAYKSPVHGAEGIFRRLRLSGEFMWIHLRVFFLREQDGRCLYYGTVRDATEQMEQRKKLEDSQKILSEVMKLAGLMGIYCEEDLPLYFANNEMLHLMGYDTYEMFIRDIGGRIIDIIHPEDRETLREKVLRCSVPGMEYRFRYRIRKRDRSFMWIMTKGRFIQAEDGRMAVISACMDITDAVLAEQSLKHTVEILENKEDELDFLSSCIPGGYVRLGKTRDMEFHYTSLGFQEITGYTKEDLSVQFHGNFADMVHPDERERIFHMMQQLKPGKTLWDIKCRVLTTHGYIQALFHFRLSEKNRESLYGVMLNTEDWKRVSLKEAFLEDMTSRRETGDFPISSPVRGLPDRALAVAMMNEYLGCRRFQTSALVLFELSRPEKQRIEDGRDSKALFSRQADRLKRFFRQEDIICLNGGYEVMVLCKNIREEDAENKKERITQMLNQEMSAKERKFFLPVRAGYTMISMEDSDFERCYEAVRSVFEKDFLL
ncbi:EAL domain-containing protein [Lacrimispora sp. JR3]|uniref:EAL domain-containing protein n=1 Tax=Lacrimispora sinapis TaxID=3111456 RepID=UPI003747B292